jgi:sorting nexin-5/6/32
MLVDGLDLSHLVLRKTGEVLAKMQMNEKKLAAKEDLKLTDLLRYYVSDTGAARDLMCRRIKAWQTSHFLLLDGNRCRQSEQGTRAGKEDRKEAA